MSIVHTYSVGDGDMFSIRHGTDNFTIIDCSLTDNNKDWIFEKLEEQKNNKGITRFISTHPDQDHIKGIITLDDEMPISNFYCVENKATKSTETDDFKRYCKLRDGDKAFLIKKGSKRRWMNQSNEERGSAGLYILWPDVKNQHYKDALKKAEKGESPNNISIILKYAIEKGASYLWMGDLETDFMELIKDEVEWSDTNILFAPHHGRDSGKIPEDVLSQMNPDIIIIGEAPSKHLNYYNDYNTITQNSAENVFFENDGSDIHIYVTNDNYTVDFLTNKDKSTYKNYIGTLEI